MAVRDTRDSLLIAISSTTPSSGVRDTRDSLLIILPTLEYGIRDTRDSLLIAVPLVILRPTPAFPGRGSSLRYSLDGTKFTQFLYLKSFSPAGVTLDTVDNTVINALASFKTRLATLLDGGKISYDGVLVPSDPSMQGVVNAELAGLLLWWQIVLTDGSLISFQAYITRHVPAKVSYDKALTMSGELTISGPVSFSWT